MDRSIIFVSMGLQVAYNTAGLVTLQTLDLQHQLQTCHILPRPVGTWNMTFFP